MVRICTVLRKPRLLTLRPRPVYVVLRNSALPLCLLCFSCLTCVMHSGLVISEARKALNLTQKQLADLSDVDHSTISRIERGLINPPARTVKALTDALGQAAAARRGAA